MCKLPFNQTILHNGRRHLSYVSGGILQLGRNSFGSRPYLLTLLDGPRADWSLFDPWNSLILVSSWILFVRSADFKKFFTIREKKIVSVSRTNEPYRICPPLIVSGNISRLVGSIHRLIKERKGGDKVSIKVKICRNSPTTLRPISVTESWHLKF